MSGVRRHFVAMFLTWGMISLLGFTSGSNIPGKPTDLRISSVQDLTITLKWKKPLTAASTPDSSSLSYILSYRATGSDAQQWIMTREIAQLRLTFGKQYIIHVQAIRSGDHQIKSNWSDDLRVDTKDLVPAKPINLRMITVKGLIGTFSWDKPQTTVKGIKDTSAFAYHVTYQNLNNGAKKQVRSSSEQMSLRLNANSGYNIQVNAYKTFNTALVGPWSDILRIKTNESVPSKPPINVKVVSSTPSSITVTWSQIPADGRHGVIQGYVIFYRANGVSRWSKRKVNLVYTQDLTGLNTGEQYYVSVAGYTKIGTGIKSSSKRIVVGGQFITTTKKITTQKPTTLPEKPHSTSLPSITSSVQVSTLASASTQGPDRTTGTSSGETAIKPSVSTIHSSQGYHTDHTTPAVVAIHKATDGPKENFLNKILIIGAPAAGGLLLLIILIIFFVLSIRRSRKRKQLLIQQNGGIPMNIVKSKYKRKRSRDMVTRGAHSVTYEPPSGHSTLNSDSMTVELLERDDEPDQPDQPVIVVQQPNGTLPRSEADDAPLLATGDSDNYNHLRVDLSTGPSKLEEGRASGLYESIGSLGKAGCSDAAKTADGKSDDEERYVTQEQVNATRDRAKAQAAPREGHYKTPKDEPYYKRPKEDAEEVPYGNTYENLPDMDRLYEVLGTRNPDDPIYENTRASPVHQDNIHKEGEYEPMAGELNDKR